jgi:hypothetical protein
LGFGSVGVGVAVASAVPDGVADGVGVAVASAALVGFVAAPGEQDQRRTTAMMAAMPRKVRR